MIKILVNNITLIIAVIFNNYAHALCVNVSEANLRSGPATTYKKTWEIYKYMPLKKVSKKGDWYKVKDVDGDLHWIYLNMVTDKIRCAVVRRENVNIRRGPGIKFKKTSFGPSIKYDTFRVIKTGKLWVKVANERGNKGWIFKELLWIQ